jgi:hypothetical protein
MTKQLLAGLAVCTSFLWADFSYEQTSKMTGGAMVKMMATFSKQMREPMVSTVLIKGDRMAHINSRTAVITDLKSETITTIDFQRQTYSVATFAQVAAMMNSVGQPRGEQGANVNFKISVKQTGQTRQIGNFVTTEAVMTLEMENADQQKGNQGSMVMINDMWLAPHVPGYGEVKAFHARMAKTGAWAPDSSVGGFGAGRSGMAKSMQEASKEIAKMDGVPVFVVMKMTGQGGPEAGPGGQSSQSSGQQTQQQEEKPSVGSVLGGRFGGFGGLGRRKQQDQTQTDQQSGQTQSKTQTQGATSSSEPGVLMEVTTETGNFSSAPVDGSKFEIPAGFKQVESQMLRRGKR